ncbi:MAG: prepilin-type N-terminal cleavage/methylation domain-containing protein [Actinobacteria bacterium]|nr:prepilin-type N-terminal cleavage/methylation domain-containing protein [Actinomycetota bacterium]
MVPCKTFCRKIQRQGGFSFIELLFALTVLGITIVPILKVFMLTTKLTNYSTNELRASQLAQDLMEEIVSLPFTDPQSPGSFGCEEIPVQPSNGRLLFDDVDDYTIYTQEGKNSWNAQKPPRDINGKQIKNADQFSRQATVYEYINFLKGKTTTEHSVSHSTLKLIKVTVAWDIPGSKPGSLHLYRVVAK